MDQIQKEDFGYYECFGENDLGTFSDFVYVDIEDAPEVLGPVSIEDENAGVEEGINLFAFLVRMEIEVHFLIFFKGNENERVEDENDVVEEPVEKNVEEEEDDEEDSGELEEPVEEDKGGQVFVVVGEDTTENDSADEGHTESVELSDVTAEMGLDEVTEEPTVEEEEPESVDEEPVDEEVVEEEPVDEEVVEEQPVDEELSEGEPEVVNYDDGENENDGDLL